MIAPPRPRSAAMPAPATTTIAIPATPKSSGVRRRARTTSFAAWTAELSAVPPPANQAPAIPVRASPTSPPLARRDRPHPRPGVGAIDTVDDGGRPLRRDAEGGDHGN